MQETLIGNMCPRGHVKKPYKDFKMGNFKDLDWKHVSQEGMRKPYKAFKMGHFSNTSKNRMGVGMK